MQARRLRRAARPRLRGPAAPRPTCHQANERERLARRSSRPEHSQASGGPASGVAGGRGDDLARAQQTKRSAVREQRASSSSRPVVRAAREGQQGLRSPATGRAAFDITAGTAGLIALRKGWMPAGSRPGDAGARCAARQPGPAQRGAPGIPGASASPWFQFNRVLASCDGKRPKTAAVVIAECAYG